MSKESAFEVGRLYQPIKAIADTLVASQKDQFVRLPGLAGYYPMGIRNQSGHAVEHSGANANLLQTGTCATGYDGNSFAHLGNGTNYLFGAGLYQITGLETWISSSIRGLTLGCWVMVDSYPSIQGGICSKFGVITDYGYSLLVHTANEFRFIVSSNGSATFAADGIVPNLGQWYFVAGRFTPSSEVALFVDGNKDVNTTAIPASINVSAQAFELGRYLVDNARILHGKVRDVFICASALSDALIEEIRATSAP